MFKAPRLKVKRADALIAEFTAISRDFLSRNPYRLYTYKTDVELILASEVRELIPEQLPLILGDAVHNLRSALDILINDAICADTQLIERESSFPIVRESDNFNNERKNKLRNASDRIVKFVKSVQPFNENVSEWLPFLNATDILDKHRIITPVIGNPKFKYVSAKQANGPGTMELHGVGINAEILGSEGIVAIRHELEMVFDSLPKDYTFFFSFNEEHAKKDITVDDAFSLMRSDVMRIIHGMEKMFIKV